MLFRQEVLNGRQQQWFGRARIVAPASQRYAMLASVGFALAILAWLLCGHYTRRVHVTGRLVPDRGLLGVATRAPGTVIELLVKEGQVVKAGEPLLTLSADRSSTALGDTSAGIVSTLSADRARLQADLSTAKRLNAEQAGALALQQQVSERQIAQIDAQLVLQDAQIALQQNMLNKVDPLLAKGYISAFQVQQQRSQLITAQADKKALLRQRADAEERRGEAVAQTAQLPLQLQTRLSEINGQLSSGSQALAQAEADRSTVLRAPQAGVISAVLINRGQAVSSGQTLATLVPAGARLQAQLLVSTASVGFVRSGNAVMVRIQAFPYQKFGLAKGSVARISESALSPQEAMVLLGQGQVDQEPMYRVDVDMSSQAVEAYGQRRPLHAGMVVDADLMLDRRRIVEWMFEPLIGLAKRNGEGL